MYSKNCTWVSLFKISQTSSAGMLTYHVYYANYSSRTPNILPSHQENFKYKIFLMGTLGMEQDGWQTKHISWSAIRRMSRSSNPAAPSKFSMDILSSRLDEPASWQRTPGKDWGCICRFGMLECAYCFLKRRRMENLISKSVLENQRGIIRFPVMSPITRISGIIFRSS